MGAVPARTHSRRHGNLGCSAGYRVRRVRMTLHSAQALCRKRALPTSGATAEHTLSDCRPAAFCGGMVSELRALQQPGLSDDWLG
eukprot:scaffold9484_cov124-Isochrysis_galbana.AAC.22